MTYTEEPVKNVTYRKVNVFRVGAQAYQSTGAADHREDLQNCLLLARRGAYGASLDGYLPALWEGLLAEKRIVLVMIEETAKVGAGPGKWTLQTRPIGFRFMCFIKDSFYQTMLYEAEAGTLKPPLCAHLFGRHKMGRSPILTRKETAQANSAGGVTLFSFTLHDDPVLETPEGVHAYASAVVMAFRGITSGYQCKASVVEGYSLHARQHIEPSGFDIVPRAYKAHYENSGVPREHQLFLAHVHRKDFAQKVGTDVYNSNAYCRPVLEGLSLLQRETLEFALEGASDEMQAQHYGVTEEAIRQRFTGIFKRVREKCPPELVMQKGMERANLLAYLRNHLEEVRPYAY